MWQNAERKSEWMLQLYSGAVEESHATGGMVSREWKGDWKMPQCSRRVQQCGGRVHGVAEGCRMMVEVPAAR